MRARQADSCISRCPRHWLERSRKEIKNSTAGKALCSREGWDPRHPSQPRPWPVAHCHPRKVSLQGTFTPALTFPLLLPQTQEDLCALVISSPALLSCSLLLHPSSYSEADIWCLKEIEQTASSSEERVSSKNAFLKPSVDFPGGSDGKESAYDAENLGLIPGLGRSPGEGNGNPL